MSCFCAYIGVSCALFLSMRVGCRLVCEYFLVNIHKRNTSRRIRKRFKTLIFGCLMKCSSAYIVLCLRRETTTDGGRGHQGSV